MHKVLIFGAGKIGSLIACLLMDSGDYQVHLADMNFDDTESKRHKIIKRFPSIEKVELDASNKQQVLKYVKSQGFTALISCLPYFCNLHIAEVAAELDINYFDLTEDRQISKAVRSLAEGKSAAFVNQCGLAPGFISIAAHDIMKKFDSLDSVKMRVGALPVNSNNALQYCLTWSTDGLINEYGNPCQAIVDKELVTVMPLEGRELIQIDGLSYEAFNTSGGLGTLAETYQGRVNNLSYKTMRYPGHCEKIRLLMNDLKLNEKRDVFKAILEDALPKTYQDVVIIYAAVTGYKDGVLLEENYLNKVYPQQIADLPWSSIQVTTASSLSAIVDMVLSEPSRYSGLIKQETFSLQEFLNNRFAIYYR